MKQHYMSKEIRDREFKKMKDAGLKVKKSSWQSVALMHPQYIVDYTEVTGIVITAQDKGLGNTIYKTRFEKLYDIEIDD